MLTAAPPCGKTRTSMSAARIDQPVERTAAAAALSHPRASPVWPTKSCVTPCARANSRTTCTKSAPSSRRTSAPRLSASCQVRLHALAFGRRRGPGLPHVNGEQPAVEPLRVAASAFKHGARVAARREADQDALVGAPGLPDAVRIEVPVASAGPPRRRPAAAPVPGVR